MPQCHFCKRALPPIPMDEDLPVAHVAYARVDGGNHYRCVGMVCEYYHDTYVLSEDEMNVIRDKQRTVWEDDSLWSLQ